MRWAATCASLLLAPAMASGHVSVAPVFTDHMVLQRDHPVRLWGNAAEGETVTVQFQGQTLSATAKAKAWAVQLAPLSAGGPEVLTVAGDRNTVVLKDVLIGDVWLCSGQSNMALPLARTEGGPALAQSPRPNLRLLTVPHRTSNQPSTELGARWTDCRPEAAAEFSGVAFWFAHYLSPFTKVPVGLIDSSYGGTPAEAWLSAEGFAHSGSTDLEALYQRGQAYYEPALRRDRRSHAEWLRACEAAKRDKKPLPFEPDEDAKRVPSVLYNAMIAPLVPLTLRGILWYQGEANAARARLYRPLFSALIRDWRGAFGEPELPFLFVQLPACSVTGAASGDWAELREAQMLTLLAEPHTAMTVTCDLGEAETMHPTRKAPVGERLALAARALCFGEDVSYSGPIYESMSLDGSRARLNFTHADRGLLSRGGPLRGFQIAGADGRFQPAEAAIEYDQVLVWSMQVPEPVAVRYGWSDTPDGNLTNGAGLPASPFRTDDWPRPEPARR